MSEEDVRTAEKVVTGHEDEALDDPLIQSLAGVIRIAVKALAILMTAVIVWGVADVIYVLYDRLSTPPFLLLNVSDILATFGAFMAVLIAIEIFVNITVYLREDVVHVRIVMATALMAVARKVIILDYYEATAFEVFALAAVVIAMSLGYWLVAVKGHAPRKYPRL